MPIKKNVFVFKGDVVEIHYKNNQIALIDIDDYEIVSKYYWGINTQGYLHSRINNGRLIRLHIFILDFPNKTIDHINRNKLDNRKSNLRLCDQNQNAKNMSLKKNNTSGFPGVSWYKPYSKWRVRIMVNRKEINLGYYDSLDDAVDVRKAGEIKYFGEFAPNV